MLDACQRNQNKQHKPRKNMGVIRDVNPWQLCFSLWVCCEDEPHSIAALSKWSGLCVCAMHEQLFLPSQSFLL